MKPRKTFSLLLWLCFSLSIGLSYVNGQTREAREKLINALEKVQDTAKTQTNSLADVANDYFKEYPVDDIDSNPSELETFVATLKAKRDNIPRKQWGDLAKAVNNLEASYKVYNDSKPANANVTGNVLGGNNNASATSVDSNANITQSRVEEGKWNLSSLVIPTVAVLGSLLAIGLIVFSVMLLLSLQRASDALAVSIPQQFNGVKARQEELGKQLAAFAVVNNGINQRLTDLHGEVRQVNRGLQLSQQSARGSMHQAAAAMPAASFAVEPVPDKRDEMPSFPIAADDFLRRMQPKSMVVKCDFQNDMLVSDPDGKGELVLIRDAGIPDEIQPLFIVPRVTQFQMRQEYYNFYEKYYDCTNPESGAVWIIDPAVVDKVSGGWQLREKGRLEVR